MPKKETGPCRGPSQSAEEHASLPSVAPADGTASPRITVLPHKRIPSPESDTFPTRDADALPSTLADALAAEWATDAHFTCYEPVCPPELGGVAVRLASGALGDVPVRMVALVGDVDDPVTHGTPEPARDEWRAATLPKVQASGLASYETRGGYRVLAELADPIELTSQADAQAWSAVYRGWCDQLRDRYGLELDRNCTDWTRLMRLPNVEREGVGAVRADVSGPLPTIDAYAIPATPATARAATPTPVAADDRDLYVAEQADLDRLAEIITPHFERPHRNKLALGLGGLLRNARMPPEAARYLVAQLPSEDSEARVKDALRAWEVGTAAGWTALAEILPAETMAEIKAVDVQPAALKSLMAKQVARAERKEKEQAERTARAPAVEPANDVDPLTLLGVLQDFRAPDEPITYLCEGLRLAASTGKISLVAGAAGGGKGPLVDHLAVCFALGLKAFGVHPCTPTNVLLIDTEGARLTMRRLRRIARELDCDPLQLDGKLFVADASCGDIVSDAYAAAIKAAVTRHKIGVVVLDAYTSAMLGAGVEASQPEYAALAKVLGGLGVLVIVVAHGNKAAAQRGGRPELHDVAYTQALGSLAQTAIVVHYPTSDKNLVEVSCARAPETEFQPFRLRWTDTRGTYSEPGSGLRCTVEATSVAAPQPADDPKALAYGRRVLERLERVLSATETYLTRQVVGDLGGGRELKLGVLQRLVDEGLLTRAVSGEAGAKGGAKVHTDYSLAPRSAANAEAFMRWRA